MARFREQWGGFTLGVAAVLLQATVVFAAETAANESDQLAPVQASDEASWNDDGSPEAETIRERYPNRAVRIERHVIQDAQDNFLNHGKWKMWDQAGNLVAEGQYNNGQRDGTWVRWIRSPNSKLFETVPYRQFRGPFVSQVAFLDGELHGTWTIYDGKKRKISQFEYEYGQRQGRWIWWYANGRKMRETDYTRDNIDGQLVEWSPDGTVSLEESYEEGRKLATKITHHKGGKHKKTEGVYLHAKLVRTSDDDWWTTKLGRYERQGQDEKHGPWTAWYSSGQVQLRGQYENDLEVDQFTWWHTNGQKSAEGSYELGKQMGKWTWWHENGQKAIRGEYAAGGPSSRWMWWKDNGKVAQRADFTHSRGRIVEVPTPVVQPPTSTARRPILTPPARRRASR